MKLGTSPLLDIRRELREEYVYPNLDERSLFGRLSHVNQLLNTEIKKYGGRYYDIRDPLRNRAYMYLLTSTQMPLANCIIDKFKEEFKQYLQPPMPEPASIIISESLPEKSNAFTFAVIAKIVHTRKKDNFGSIKIENTKEDTEELYRKVGTRLLLRGTCDVSNNGKPSLDIMKCELRGGGTSYNNKYDKDVTYCVSKSRTLLLISSYERENGDGDRSLYMIHANDSHKEKKWLLNKYIGGCLKNEISQHTMMGTMDCFKLELMVPNATVPYSTFFVHPDGTIKCMYNVVLYKNKKGNECCARVSKHIGPLLVIPQSSQETSKQRKIEAESCWEGKEKSKVTFEITENILDIPPQSIIKHPSYIKFIHCSPLDYIGDLRENVLNSISLVPWSPEEYLTLAAILHRANDRDSFSTIIRNKFLESTGIRKTGWFHEKMKLLYDWWHTKFFYDSEKDTADEYFEQIYPLKNLYAVDFGDYQIPERPEDAAIVKKTPEAIIEDLHRSRGGPKWFWKDSFLQGCCRHYWNNHRFVSIAAGLGVFAAASWVVFHLSSYKELKQ